MASLLSPLSPARPSGRGRASASLAPCARSAAASSAAATMGAATDPPVVRVSLSPEAQARPGYLPPRLVEAFADRGLQATRWDGDDAEATCGSAEAAAPSAPPFDLAAYRRHARRVFQPPTPPKPPPPTPPSPPDPFSPPLRMPLPSAAELGATLLHCRRLPSTQTLLHDSTIATRLPPGSCLVADAQTSGRGRGRNGWSSCPGGGSLTFSVAVDVSLGPSSSGGSGGGRFGLPPPRVPLVQHCVCLALLRGLDRTWAACWRAGRRVARQTEASTDSGGKCAAAVAATSAADDEDDELPVPPPPDWRIKWPNDLYAPSGAGTNAVGCSNAADSNDARGGGVGADSRPASPEPPPRKVAGVLCEARSGPGGLLAVTVGVGVNLRGDFGGGNPGAGPGRGGPGGYGRAGVAELVRARAAEAAATSSNGTWSMPDRALDAVEAEATRERVLAETLWALERVLSALGSTDPAAGFGGALRDEYVSRWVHGGAVVAVEGEGEGEGGGGGGGGAREREGRRATIVDLGPDGYLIARLEDGREARLDPDMTRLDVLSGRVRAR